MNRSGDVQETQPLPVAQGHDIGSVSGVVGPAQRQARLVPYVGVRSLREARGAQMPGACAVRGLPAVTKPLRACSDESQERKR